MNTEVRRGLFAACGAMALGTALLAAALGVVSAQPARPRLRLAVAVTPMPALPNSVMWLAKDLRFYEREGLDVDIVEVQASPSVVVAMRTGDVDVGNVGPEEVVQLTATKQLEMRAIHSPGGRNFFMIASRDNIRSLADLRGKTFGISRLGGFDHFLTALVLEAKGVDPDGLSMLAIGAPNVRAQALVAGRIDATTLSLATWLTIDNAPRLKVLFDHDEYYAAAPLINKVNAVTARTLRERPDHLRRFTAAIIKAARLFAGNKQVWMDTVGGRRPDMDRSDVGRLWEQFKATWPVNGQMNLREYERTADAFYKTDDFKQVPRIVTRDWVDTQFVDSLLRELGVYPRVDDPGRAIR